ncbi:MAG: hypothetical protein ACKOYM_06020, partial [Actinomycetes bacterium]
PLERDVLTASFELGDLTDAWNDELQRLARVDAVVRLWDGDHTVVQDDPTDVSDRLGWLHVVPRSLGSWPMWTELADQISEDFDHVVLVGMGGSSLFPELLATTFERGEGFPSLSVLDSTHPDAVRRVLDDHPPDRTLVVVSSKSGSTVETRSHLEVLWSRHPHGSSFVAITDPGSGLETLAHERGFRAVVHGVPEIGGRFSALSAFGMLPAALLGLDGDDLLVTADEASAVLGPDTPVDQHLGAQLGAFMAVAATAGRDRLTLLIDPRLEAFGDWLEQLIAESTGKHGVGVLPVVGESAEAPGAATRAYVVIGSVEHGPLDGPSVRLTVEEPADVGAQVFCWEFATAIAGVCLGVNPFDQPDVESAKVAARHALADPQQAPLPTVSLDDAVALLRPDDALVIAAFTDPQLRSALEPVRRALGDRLGVPTTLGIGPRFLHSTGQLHKGGPDRIVVLQVLDAPGVGEPADEPVPGEDYTFGQLIRAQADGDVAALQSSGHRVARVSLRDLLA